MTILTEPFFYKPKRSEHQMNDQKETQTKPQPEFKVEAPALSFARYPLFKGMVIGVVISDGKGGFILNDMPYQIKMTRTDGKIILKPAAKKGDK